MAQKILISQPKPNELNITPYKELETKYGVSFDFARFFKNESVSVREFRNSKTYINDYTAVIFNSRHAVDNFFNLAKEVRVQVKESMKYFCLSEAIANYLQKYIQYRKRKIFFTNQCTNELIELIKKNNTENYLLPCSEVTNNEISNALEEAGIKFRQTTMYRTVSEKLDDIDITKYDIIVLYSPKGITALFDNWKDYKQNKQTIATFGDSTKQYARECGLKVGISAPTSKFFSMTAALDDYLNKKNKI